MHVFCPCCLCNEQGTSHSWKPAWMHLVALSLTACETLRCWHLHCCIILWDSDRSSVYTYQPHVVVRLRMQDRGTDTQSLGYWHYIDWTWRNTSQHECTTLGPDLETRNNSLSVGQHARMNPVHECNRIVPTGPASTTWWFRTLITHAPIKETPSALSAVCCQKYQRYTHLPTQSPDQMSKHSILRFTVPKKSPSVHI